MPDVIVREHNAMNLRSMAVFSPCEKYRYGLQRQWGDDKNNVVNFIMMNPSTADERRNDPTVERCQRRAVKAGYHGFIVTNVFAFRSTDPAGLLAATDPVGPHNDRLIVETAKMAKTVVCAWGQPPKPIRGRCLEVAKMLREQVVKLHALRINSDGSPGHPLYIGFGVPWKEWTVA
jgi:hypothetical protein